MTKRSRSDIKETVEDFAGGFRFVSTQDCTDAIEAVKMAPSIYKKRTKSGTRYLGNAPLVVAQIWAKLCGAPPGTREFAEYARKQLESGEYSKFKVQF